MVFEDIERKKRGEGPTIADLFKFVTGALDRLEALSRERALTESELEEQREMEERLEFLRSHENL